MPLEFAVILFAIGLRVRNFRRHFGVDRSPDASPADVIPVFLEHTTRGCERARWPSAPRRTQ